MLLVGAALAPAHAHADGITYGHDDGRAGWYPEQSGLSPALLSDGAFGQQFSTPVTGQVYAQPLATPQGVLVATEGNNAYALDPGTGAVRWQRNLGPTFDAGNGPKVWCSDLTPEIGVTGTPVVDTATATAYMAAKTSASGGTANYDLHALDMATGAERPGFPVRYQGPADNAPAATFDATYELQRPALLLLGGVVYAAFGGHCDQGPWKGWIVGIDAWHSGDTGPGTIASRWVAPDVDGAYGAGIWQAGSGLMSDGPGRIFAATGNSTGAGTPSTPAPSGSPPGALGESAVRLAVQANGTIAPDNFFTPYDAANLDSWDADFAAGGPVALPDSFGDATHPHLLAVAGKKGILYTLDRDALGGFKQGTGGGDLVVDAAGQRGGVWSKPSVWPGDGGYVYVPTASGAQSATGTTGAFDVYRRATVSGHPALVWTAKAADSFGLGSSPAIVTSDGTTAGSAIVWIVRSPSSAGTGAELRAYRAVPDGSSLTLLGAWPVGTAAKFTPPGVGAGKLYVGTRDGHVIGFGSPATLPMSAGSGALATTTVGSTTSGTATFTAQRTVTVTGLTLAGDASFARGTPTPALPTTLHAGDTLQVPVTFSPTSPGDKGATLTAQSDQAAVPLALSATARAQQGLLTTDARVLDFGGVILGDTQRRAVTFANQGATDLHIAAVEQPGSPFAVHGLDGLTTLGPGDSVVATVTFAPRSSGDYADQIKLDSDTAVPPGRSPDDMGVVGLTGSGATAPQLVMTPASLDFGVVAPGTEQLQSFTLRNAGGSVLTIYKSKPPAGGTFTPVDAVDEGTTLQPGQTRTVRVRFAPSLPGTFSDAWALNADDATGVRYIGLAGRSSSPDAASPSAPEDAPPLATPVTPVTPTATAAPATPRVTGLRLTARRVRTRTRLSIRAPGVAAVRVTLERRSGRSWSRRRGARAATLRGGARAITIDARPLRTGTWRVVVAPLPTGVRRAATFVVVR